MAQTNWEADKMLDVYIHDYLVKRDLKATAQAFQAEGKVSTDPVAIDAPGGFLFEWWSVFWDIFIARTNEKHSDVAASYLESQMNKAREQHHQPLNNHHQQQQQQHQQQQHQQNLQMQQFLFQRHAQQQQLQQQQHQQQRADGSHMLNGSVNGLLGNEVLLRQNSGNATAVNPKMYEDRIDRLKLPLHCDSLDDAGSKQRFGENVGQMLDTNHKPSGNSDQSTVQMLHGVGGGVPQQMQGRNQQAESIADMKGEMNSTVNSRGAAPDTSFIGLSGSNQAGNGLTLKGWPLTGLDHLRSGFQKPFMQQQTQHQQQQHQQQQHQHQQQQSFHQLSMLTPQQQIVLAQQNLTRPSDSENRRMRIMLNNRNMNAGKDDTFQNAAAAAAAAMQAGCSALPRGDVEMMQKLKMAQLHHQQQQQLQSHALSNQEKIGGSGSTTMDGAAMSSFRGNDQAMKNQNGRKRKQAVTSSGPANSSGTANTAGPSPSSAPSTPSTQIPGDVISMPALPQSSSSSKPLIMFGTTDGQNQLWGDKDFELQAEMDHFVDDGSLDDNVESFLSHDDDDDADPRDPVGRSTDIGEGFTFAEVGCIRASTSKVVCCHFSSDGKLLATGGNDKKVVLWHTDSLKPKTPLEEHSSMITDVRFSPSLPRLATSSFDKTIRVWDADNPGYSLRTFTGHSASVMSLDFHPNKEDLICSCDGDGDMRYWSVNNGTCVRRLKGGNTQTRFQPRFGRYLAAASDNLVSVFDSETQTCCHSLQGHTKPILSLCWNACGDFLASVSEESVRVWSFGSGSDGECVHERGCTGNKFHSSAFHPTYTSLLVIGCYQSMELWSMAENKTMTLSAHEGLIASLSSSVINGFVASAGHDKIVKLWK